MKLGLYFQKQIKWSENDFEDWDWVHLLTESSFVSILLNENGVVIPLMTESVESFCEVDGGSKYFPEKSITIIVFICWKTTESTWYDVVQSNEWIHFYQK